jgi:glycosyltransferase involved in cell wall biosynthesis
VPIVVQEHFTEDQVPLYQRIADRMLRGRDAYGLAVSEEVKRFMIHQRFTTAPIEIIWNGVPDDLHHERNDADADILRTELNIPRGAKVIGIVGRLAEMKGHRYFLDAGVTVIAKHSNVRFLILGEGPLRQSLEDQADRLGISGHVIFTGYRTDAVRCFALCDIAVVASIFGEGFCTVGIEAHAANTPLITTDLPAFAGLYIDGDNARVVSARDGAAMADAMIELLENPGLCRQLVEGGARRLAQCRMSRIVQQYTEFYDKLTQQKHEISYAAAN